MQRNIASVADISDKISASDFLLIYASRRFLRLFVFHTVVFFCMTVTQVNQRRGFTSFLQSCNKVCIVLWMEMSFLFADLTSAYYSSNKLRFRMHFSIVVIMRFLIVAKILRFYDSISIKYNLILLILRFINSINHLIILSFAILCNINSPS